MLHNQLKVPRRGFNGYIFHHDLLERTLMKVVKGEPIKPGAKKPKTVS